MLEAREEVAGKIRIPILARLRLRRYFLNTRGFKHNVSPGY